MNLADVTPLILTMNEAPNLRETLQAVSWAAQIVIVDSGSTDETLAIAAEFPQVTVHYHQFDHFADQCNFGLSKIETPWTLSLDADYRCPAELAREIERLDESCDGYRTQFRYCIYGKPLRRSLYPPRTVLYRTRDATYQRDGHAHRVKVEGEIGKLKTEIRHDDWKPFVPWLHSQVKYAALEAEKILGTPPDQLHWKDRIRKKIVLAAPLTLVYCLFYQGLILNGWAGVFYAMQRTLAEFLLAMVILDRKVKGS